MPHLGQLPTRLTPSTVPAHFHFSTQGNPSNFHFHHTFHFYLFTSAPTLYIPLLPLLSSSYFPLLSPPLISSSPYLLPSPTFPLFSFRNLHHTCGTEVHQAVTVTSPELTYFLSPNFQEEIWTKNKTPQNPRFVCAWSAHCLYPSRNQQQPFTALLDVVAELLLVRPGNAPFLTSTSTRPKVEAPKGQKEAKWKFRFQAELPLPLRIWSRNLSA